MSIPLPVYQLMPIELVRGSGCTVWDSTGKEYLDLYGGHAVISIGHAHPEWSAAIATQASTLGYYSNSVRIPIQEQAAQKLGVISNREDCNVFFVNSGAEANENAIKLASFVTGRSKIVACSGAFHGRTSLAVAATDNPKIVAPVNQTSNIVHVALNSIEGMAAALAGNDVAAVIVEGIQGVAGVHVAQTNFLQSLQSLCNLHGTLLILDEVQSGAGRTGKYFSHQHAGITPPLITLAKGIGNGFPVAALMVSSAIPVWEGMLGTTFGGNHMACAATKAVVDVTLREGLMQNAEARGRELRDHLKDARNIVEIRGMGLMLGIELATSCSTVRNLLVSKYNTLTGNSANPNVLRILPPLSITSEQITRFANALLDAINEAGE